MYFDFEDYRPDISPVGSAISRREGVLLAFIAHLLAIILLLLWPKLFPEDLNAKAARVLAAQEQRLREAQQQRFVFVQPRIERPVPAPPPVADSSDRDRLARSPERAPKPTNPLPFSRGNSFEKVDVPGQPREVARGRGPQPDPGAGRGASQSDPAPSPDQAANALKVPESQSALQFPTRPVAPQSGANSRGAAAGGSLGDALRNLQKYVQGESFNNQTGSSAQYGPDIQFDTKGVEFGPWLRRFKLQVERNWFVPYSVMSMRGRVVITFNVHRDGTISDLAVVSASPVEAFNSSAYGALSASNPTQPLPPEYPADKVFITVTFHFNEASER